MIGTGLLGFFMILKSAIFIVSSRACCNIGITSRTPVGPTGLLVDCKFAVSYFASKVILAMQNFMLSMSCMPPQLLLLSTLNKNMVKNRRYFSPNYST